MAYTIRYGPRNESHIRRPGILVIRLAGAGILAAVLVAAGLLDLPGRDLLEELFLPENLSRREQALFRGAQALASGEEWYHAAIVWCRTMLGLISG